MIGSSLKLAYLKLWNHNIPYDIAVLVAERKRTHVSGAILSKLTSGSHPEAGPFTSVSCVTADSHQKMNTVTTGGTTQI